MFKKDTSVVTCYFRDRPLEFDLRQGFIGIKCDLHANMYSILQNNNFE